MNAKDFLEQYFEYSCYASASAPSYVFRTKQLESLLAAFGIARKNADPKLNNNRYVVGGQRMERRTRLEQMSELEYFESGEFLNDRPYLDNMELVLKIEQFALKNISLGLKDQKGRNLALAWLFNDLMNFRKEVYKVANPWGGFLEGFEIGLYYGKCQAENLKQVIRENLGEIDETLSLLIDPKKKEYILEDLVNDFGYPDVDLKEMDREWEMENW